MDFKVDDNRVLTYGWDAAIRGMRNPLESWDKSDSDPHFEFDDGSIDIGYNDIVLMWRLSQAGSDHGKFMRFITVTMDIEAPLYWWKEFDTYKVGTTANSCSTMHTITKHEFTTEMFAHDMLNESSQMVLDIVVNALNKQRVEYLRYEKLAKTDASYQFRAKDAWYNIIQLLPSSWIQKRTVILNYEVLRRMYKARLHHKLFEWRNFCEYIRMLPYSFLITGDDKAYESYLDELRKGMEEDEQES